MVIHHIFLDKATSHQQLQDGVGKFTLMTSPCLLPTLTGSTKGVTTTHYWEATSWSAGEKEEGWNHKDL
jgi:hypothetical protein